MPKWNPKILDKHIAPGISTFTTAEIQDLSGKFPQAEYWVRNYFLNGILRLGYPDRTRQVVVGFLRRASHAYIIYHEARQMTIDYLDGNDPLNPRVGRYFDMIAKWEVFAIDMTIAFDLFKWISNGQGAFAKNDGSKESRLYEVGNKVKHVPTCVNSGQCTIDDTVPLWVNASGLNSFGITVTYDETAEVLSDVCKVANELQDPLTFVNMTKGPTEGGESA
ncbi:hypothetical protein [Halomonas alimentaria]|uniref:hypothetical protein n=1 Tax=Halomonas alimentaria TaxID=147248 RepID=UPI00248F65EE|nr:hypothetical protein [Halomonas alimentaria]